VIGFTFGDEGGVNSATSRDAKYFFPFDAKDFFPFDDEESLSVIRSIAVVVVCDLRLTGCNSSGVGGRG